MGKPTLTTPPWRRGNGTALLRRDGDVILDQDSVEAFLIRKDSDSGDVFVVDTISSLVTINGDLELGANNLKFSNTLVREQSATQLRLRNAADTAFVGLYGEQFWAAQYSVSTGIDYWGTAAGLFDTNSSDDAYVAFRAKDNGVGLIEVARIQGAADPYFQATRLVVTGTTTLNTVAYTWPVADGAASEVLSTDGAGNLSWAGVTSRVQLLYQVGGTQVVGTDLAMPLRPSGTVTISEVFIELKTAPVGADFIVDVLKNGTSIFNVTPANRPKILDGAKTGTSGAPDTTALAKDDQITISVIQVGSTTPGVDLSVHVRGDAS